MKIPFKTSIQLRKLVGVILLVCGLQLYGQQTASGAEAEAKAATIITFDPAGSQGTSPFAINPAGAITGYYSDGFGVAHGFLRTPGPHGTITTFDVPAVGALPGAGSTPGAYPEEGTFATGITPDVAISGYYLDTNGLSHGFVRAPNGTYTTFDAPPTQGTGIQPTAINPAGTTTGTFYDTGGTPQGFVRTRNGTFTKFDPSNGTNGQQQIGVTAINPAGAVTGYYQSSDITWHDFLRAPNGTFTPFDPTPPVLYSSYTQAMAINPAGAITGYYQGPGYGGLGPSHGFLRAPNGTIISFDPPGSTSTFAFAINPAGTITGNYATDQYHGFLRARYGHFTTFDPLGSIGTSPSAINPAGAITGNYTDANFVQRGFLRIPAQQDE
jgi:hypothetical protein